MRACVCLQDSANAALPHVTAGRRGKIAAAFNKHKQNEEAAKVLDKRAAGGYSPCGNRYGAVARSRGALPAYALVSVPVPVSVSVSVSASESVSVPVSVCIPMPAYLL